MPAAQLPGGPFLTLAAGIGGAAALAAKSIHLQTECDAGVCLQGDAELLVSLLCNLVQNGCRASQKGGRMLLAGRVQGGEKGAFVIEVTDYGCGIAPKDLPKITRAFYMADKSRSRSEGGAGLGLALAERIAALHGARLEFASRLGEGTRVRVTFTKHLQAGEDFGEGITVEAKLTRAALEYRYVPFEGGAGTENGGLLCPVWNFYGAASAARTQADARSIFSEAAPAAEGQELLLASVDASDGRVYGE